jgi:hypothetical protein
MLKILPNKKQSKRNPYLFSGIKKQFKKKGKVFKVNVKKVNRCTLVHWARLRNTYRNLRKSEGERPFERRMRR